MESYNIVEIKPLQHHIKHEISRSRAKYREGRHATAVKVYTINQESSYLLIQGVPAVGASDDLKRLCEQYGTVQEFKVIDEYPCEEFTEVFLVKYKLFHTARAAKRMLDEKCFYGGCLHVCYAPEFESLHETRTKLQSRRKFIASATNKDHSTVASAAEQYHIKQSTSVSVPSGASQSISVHSKATQRQTVSRHPKHILNKSAAQPVTYIWAGKEYTLYPPTPKNTVHTTDVDSSVTPKQEITTLSFVPRTLVKKVPMHKTNIKSS